MYRRAVIVALSLFAVLRARPQAGQSDAGPQPNLLKSASHAVQLEVFVTDRSGSPVHGLQRNDFVVTDNDRKRDIRIFAGEIDANQPAPSFDPTAPPADAYSNRVGMRDEPIFTALVIDAVPRPDGLQNNMRIRAALRPELMFNAMRAQAKRATLHLQPGQAMAIYAACPDLRVVQNYTSDLDRLTASLNAFTPPPIPKVSAKKQPQTIEALVPPILSALREAAARMPRTSGRKSVVWISQPYDGELNLKAIGDQTDSTIAAFQDADIALYAVSSSFSIPTCRPIGPDDPGTRTDQPRLIDMTCSAPPSVGDQWMDYLARATGGRAFNRDASAINAIHVAYPAAPRGGIVGTATYQFGGHQDLVTQAIRFAVDDARYAYVMGFYIPESELDDRVHTLGVTLPGKPKLEVRYRSGYAASARATAPLAGPGPAGPDTSQEPASPLKPDVIGIDGKIDIAAKAKNELRVSLALAPETVTRTADGVVVLDATFIQTDDSGKQLAKIEETVRAPSPEPPSNMVRYARVMKLINGAVLLHITIRDQATNRVGSITIPIEK